MGFTARGVVLEILFLLALFFARPGTAEPLKTDSSASSKGKFIHVFDQGGVASMSVRDRMVAKYIHENVPFKPYLKELLSPAGVNVLLDAPPDHLHHHGVMFAVAVDGVDFWQEAKGPGRQEQQVPARAYSNDSQRTLNIARGGIDQPLKWLKPDSDGVLLNEQRTIEVIYVDGLDASLLTWQSILEVPKGKPPAALTGSHYFGLGMRFIESMNKTGQFINSDNAPGDIVRGEERVTPANWCAYTAEADGKPVTVAMFGHPKNPRAPTTWFTMATPFAYMSATLNLWKQPLTLTAGQPLVLHYGIAVWDGRVDAARIDNLYQQWITWASDMATPTGSDYSSKPKP